MIFILLIIFICNVNSLQYGLWFNNTAYVYSDHAEYGIEYPYFDNFAKVINVYF